MTTARSTTGGFLALTAATFFGISGAVAAGLFDEISPARVAQARSLIAVALLVPYAAYRGVLSPSGGLVKFALLGLNLALVNVTFYWAIDSLGVGPGSTVQFLGPTFVLVWIAVVRRHAVGAVAWASAAAAVVGVGMVTEAWNAGDLNVEGLGAGLAAALLFAAYLIYGEFLARDHPPARIGAWGFVFATVIWAVVLPWWTFPTGLGGDVLAGLVVVGVLGTAVPFVLEFAALTMASSGVVGIVATAEPPVGALAAAILLDQQLGATQWIGIGVVVIAVAAVQRWGLSEVEGANPLT